MRASRPARRRSILVCADDPAIVDHQELIPEAVGDRVLDEPDAAVAHADIHAAGMQAPRLSPGIVVAGVAIAGHAELAAVGELSSEGPAGLSLVAAVVAVGVDRHIL